MEDRKRTVFAIIIALVLVIALLYSFGLNLFSSAPQVELADPNETDNQNPTASISGDESGISIEIAPSTVQSVIASLSRYESYSRSLLVTYFWGDDNSSVITSEVWEDGGWTRTKSLLASGIIEHSIVGDSKLWLWYEENSNDPEALLYEGQATESMSDQMQHLPTYEDVLELDPASITSAGYMEYMEQPCVYVEAEQQTLGYLYRYWISETNGLLMATETEKSGVLVYRMESGEVISPLAAVGEIFVLPDGSVLHDVD